MQRKIYFIKIAEFEYFLRNNKRLKNIETVNELLGGILVVYFF